MPGLLLTMNAVVLCAHGGQVKLAAPNPRVKVMGTSVPLPATPCPVAGCTLPPPPTANGPCVTVMWLTATGTRRVKSQGQPLLCQSSTANCVPTGTPIVVNFAGQTRVKGI